MRLRVGSTKNVDNNSSPTTVTQSRDGILFTDASYWASSSMDVDLSNLGTFLPNARSRVTDSRTRFTVIIVGRAVTKATVR